MTAPSLQINSDGTIGYTTGKKAATCNVCKPGVFGTSGNTWSSRAGCPCKLWVTFKGFEFSLGTCQCWYHGAYVDLTGIRINALDLNDIPIELNYDFARDCWVGSIPCDIDYWISTFNHGTVDGDATGCPGTPTGKMTALEIVFDVYDFYLGVPNGLIILQTATGTPIFQAYAYMSGACFADNVFCNQIKPVNNPGTYGCGVSYIGNGCAVIRTTSDPPTFDCTTCDPNPWRQARDCETGSFIDVWMRSSDVARIAEVSAGVGFHVIGSSPAVCGYFDMSDSPADAPDGTVYVLSQITAHACSDCPKYRQARRCSDVVEQQHLPAESLLFQMCA